MEGNAVQVIAPLQYLTKQEIINLGSGMGVDYSQTVTCYQADDSGAACGECEACQLRKTGFHRAGLDDPTIYC